ncbi:MAG TPA: serine/threonine-protein kinase, partial [Planctomycetota bacterium]|nr:serine/threonine-protein kinase [Planctomycetota bacterium]
MSLGTTGLEPRLDLRLGQMAVRKGHLTAAQLQEALEEQARGVRRGRKRPRRLGVILAEKKFMTDTVILALLEEQEARLLSEQRRRREDVLLGRILVDALLIEVSQVEECLALQAQALEAGAEVPLLGDLLVEKSYASRALIDQALELQAKVHLCCTACDQEQRISELPADSLDQCPACGGPLEALLEPDIEPQAADPSSPPSDPLEEVSSIGRYRVIRPLGQGAMGTVYEALDPELGRKVALKILRHDLEPGAGSTASEVNRFLREAKLVANLPRHAHIVAVYETGEQAGRHYIAMERIEGATFSEWRRKGGIPLRKQVRILRDIALAIQHAHDHGVLHRDLKPGNILVDAGERPYVVDFGLARTVAPGSEDRPGLVCGTPDYMSPEQAQGSRDLDGRCDVYALGAMLYEVLSGKPPWKGAHPDEILLKLRSGESPPPPGRAARFRSFSSVDAGIEQICQRAIAAKVSDRTATARTLATELTLWMEAKDKASRDALRGAGKWTRRRILILTAGAGLLAIALAVGLRPAGLSPAQRELRRCEEYVRRARFQEALD